MVGWHSLLGEVNSSSRGNDFESDDDQKTTQRDFLVYKANSSEYRR